MSPKSLTKSILAFPKPTRFVPSRLIDSTCKKVLYGKLELIQEGFIQIIEPSGARREFGNPEAPSHLRTQVHFHRDRAFSRIALGGSVGTGESYVDSDWSCSGLVELVQIFVLNRDVLNAVDGGAGALFQPLQKFLHSLRANDEEQARKNIHAHYDLGNDFFSLFLDPSWMYSSGYFKSPTSTLEEAQFEKNDRICRQLGLAPEHHLVEIGTGWGGFAIHAAKNYGCRVTTTTISKNQFDLAASRIKAEGLEDRITLLFQDYRSLEGQFDRLLSIEMIEAVGAKYLDTYVAKCSSLLKPDGLMALQAILIQDQFYEQAVKSVDFIQTHIFPGAFIPSTARILESTQTRSDLRLLKQEDFGTHYARTIHTWAEKLKENQQKITQLGYPDHLYRLWSYYFAYCEGGFKERQISVAHFFFAKPRFRSELESEGALS